jgi:hypothetical protein
MTIQKADKFVRFLNGPVFGCPGPSKIYHSKTGLVLYLVVDCIQSISKIRTVRTSNGHFPDAFRVRFTNGLAAILHSKTGRMGLVLEWSTSLDHFIKKRVITNILFMTK